MGNLFSCCCKKSRKDHRNYLGKPILIGSEDEDLKSLIIGVLNVDPLIFENGKAHRTSKYELMKRPKNKVRLIVRRGQVFYISLTLSKNYDRTIDGLSLVFTLDGVSNPTRGTGTLITIPVLNSNERFATSWQATVEESVQNKILIKITTSAKAHIGKWKLEIDTKRKDIGGGMNFSLDEPFYLIFNPWCPDDAVYMANENERVEYILEESGLIFRGTCTSISTNAWQYSQFEEDILECALYLIAVVGGVRPSLRNDPVMISRCLSAAINDNDDDGVLTGNWQKNIQGGTKPSQWMGSKEILQKYYKTKTPVRFGQCWVYGGVLATVCRAIGLPCRVITNYMSAHDTQNSLTLDYFVDDEGNVLEDLTKDSIWNYHVWNEVWMERNDIGSEYSGWQAIDATPQELSEGYFQCGPASVVAIKRGEVQKPYDSGFLYTEVNADACFWRYYGPSKPMKLMNKNIDYIGQFISTKAVGSCLREDITDSYKHSENSTEERDIMLKVLRQSEHAYCRYYLNENFNDIKFNFGVHDSVTIGEPFNVQMNLHNTNQNEVYTLTVILRVEVMTYTGKCVKDVKKMEWKNLIMKPGHMETVVMPVKWDEYSQKLLDDTTFHITCMSKIHQTNYEYFAQDDIRVKKPDIIVKVLTDPIVGYKLEGTAEFQNPLPIPLKKGMFTIAGPGLTESLNFKLSQPVKSGESVKCSYSMTPTTAERATIVANFHAQNLTDVSGFKELIVKSR